MVLVLELVDIVLEYLWRVRTKHLVDVMASKSFFLRVDIVDIVSEIIDKIKLYDELEAV